jgi:hypothetical protein
MTTTLNRVLPLASVRRFDVTSVLVAALGLLIVTPVASTNGGYSPTTWGWITVSLACVAITVLVWRAEVALGRFEWVVLGGGAALFLWTLVSSAWSNDVEASVLSAERLAVYLTAIAAAFVVVRTSTYGPMLLGVWGGSSLVCAYALLTRVYRDRFIPTSSIAGNRLADPIGYWNGLGFLAAFTLLLAAALLAEHRSRVVAALAAASTVPVAVALYFTYSRGALLSLAVGLAAAFALSPRRLRFALVMLIVAPWPALAIAYASNKTALTSVQFDATRAAHEGASVVRLTLVLMLCAAVVGFAFSYGRRRVHVPRSTRRGFAIAIAVVVVAALGAVTQRYGSPPKLAHQVWHSFSTKPTPHTNDLNARLFSLSGNGRTDVWDGALQDFRRHQLVGSGAGTFQREWLQHRSSARQVVNAHSLYLETLAELGVPGLVFLALLLGAPLVALVRARRRRFVAIAGGAYVAFLIHAAVDWDWQLPGVTLPALLVAGCIVIAARTELHPRAIVRSRWALVGSLALVAAFSAYTLAANRALAKASNAVVADRFADAVSSAKRASTLEPWAAEPWQVRAQAELQRGNLPAARADLRRALAKAPDDWRLWLDLALASTGRERLAAVREAARLNPYSVEIAQVAPALGLPKR